MGDVVSAFLSAIPAAAASPLALIAYLATVAAWTFIAYRVRRFDALMSRIERLPESDRRPVIEAEFRNARIPRSLSPEDFLRQQRQAYIFYAFLALCAVMIILFGMTFYTFEEKRKRADNLTEQLLGNASSQFQSSVNTLGNGQQMVRDTAQEMGPPPTNGQISDAVDKMVQAGMRDGGQINERFGQMFGGGKLQRVSKVLNNAASIVDQAFEPIADCYRKVECGKGAEFAKMCSSVRSVAASIGSINSTAATIPGITMNYSDAPPMFGNGSVDVYFDAVKSTNINFLNSEVCQ